ncbi:iron complex transport system ATP-binding protein [Melghirimyces thermohalophilus]|uniref:Iron complex transport system ATP-binding protein n=1 Tax=Melghirimyces thermohalophilus TaxID=1236220 RepID=A0A1G6PJU5_9BACL|nr:ABC transporter ATP-binding protein [Melghirimyces thermohalophilus]SDC80338.1 iron complex transport system ATP-binding protein [Melghirimyces thermohalophilus]
MSRLHAENLHIGYGDRLIVQGLNVSIPDQQMTAIIGPNGCGKSTLLKAMTRIISPRSGSVLLDGMDIARENTKTVAKNLAILPQTPEGASGLTVAELVSFGRFPYQKGWGRLTEQDRKMIDWALEMTGTEGFKDRPVDTLSGGQRQRVWIALALAQETDIIFLDEPTTYLDLAHQLEVLELLQKLNREQGRTIIMVLHDLNQAARFADYMIAMKRGRVVKAGTSEEVISPDVLREIFHIDAIIDRDPRTDKPICLTYHLIKGEVEHHEEMADSHPGTVATVR